MPLHVSTCGPLALIHASMARLNQMFIQIKIFNLTVRSTCVVRTLVCSLQSMLEVWLDKISPPQSLWPSGRLVQRQKLRAPRLHLRYVVLLPWGIKGGNRNLNTWWVIGGSLYRRETTTKMFSATETSWFPRYLSKLSREVVSLKRQWSKGDNYYDVFSERNLGLSLTLCYFPCRINESNK